MARMSATEVANLQEQLALLEAEKQQLKAELKANADIRISEKGAVSVYGFGRFPVTLYSEQWAKLLNKADAITEFIADNKAMLKTKGEK